MDDSGNELISPSVKLEETSKAGNLERLSPFWWIIQPVVERNWINGTFLLFLQKLERKGLLEGTYKGRQEINILCEL